MYYLGTHLHTKLLCSTQPSTLINQVDLVCVGATHTHAGAVCHAATMHSSGLRGVLSPVCTFNFFCLFILSWLMMMLSKEGGGMRKDGRESRVKKAE